MKKVLMVSACILMSGCTGFAQKYVEISDSLGLTPDYAKPIEQEQSTKSFNTPQVPPNTPEGEFETTSSNGLVFKSYVENGKFNRYADVYYPNGQLQSHTVLKDGLVDGWSYGYTPQGKLMSRILYEKGKIIKQEKVE
ncbi:hypothetical protein DES31_0292 [Otariodibacter oris]|uniref:MORN repeat protein n=2 Tax=Otariodibacter oris TaxID=1032623 RepID=A0A420XI97_9PAST|nr:hypothetical protein DES31_0292 [Otariodibacter oris]